MAVMSERKVTITLTPSTKPTCTNPASKHMPALLNIQGEVSGICSTLPLTDKGILDLLSTW
jgi:hypothetical protein